MLDAARLFCASGCLALAACSPAPQQATPQRAAPAPFSLAETQTPLKFFSDVCLQDLPDLANGRARAARSGFQLASQDDGGQIYRSDSAKPLVVVLADNFEGNSEKVCGVAFSGPGDAEAVGKLFLAETNKKTGAPRKKYPSSFFNYAYHLGNGSVATHDVRPRNGQTRHFFLITEPVPESDVPKYIYN